MSCPGTRGYWMPGHHPSLTRESLCQIPHAWTLIRTQPGSGSGISRSTSSKDPFACGTWTARIFFAIPYLSRQRVPRQPLGQIDPKCTCSRFFRDSAPPFRFESDPCFEKVVTRHFARHYPPSTHSDGNVALVHRNCPLDRFRSL